MTIPSRTRMAAALWLAGAGVLLLSPTASRAAPTFKVSGYGTVAGTITDDTGYKFRSSMNQSEGADHGFDFFTDSKLGVQGVANFNNGFSITGQLLGQRKREDGTATSNNDFNVGFEWLYAQYSPTSNIDLRAGRVVLPAFMISDSRNVGYSQPWLRAPISVYAGMPLTNLDGVQGNFRIPMGSAIFSVQPTYGKSSYNISSSSLVIKDRSKWVAGMNMSLEYGDWLVRAGQVQSRTPELALDLFGPYGDPISYNMKDKFSSLGLQYDNGSAIAMVEWTQRKMSNMPTTGPAAWNTQTIPYLHPTLGLIAIPLSAAYDDSGTGGKPLARSDAFYVAGGWRFGSVLPMLAYGQTKSKLTNVKNKELSASIRYDFMANVALKVQISRFQVRDSQVFVTPSSDENNPADYNKKINVFSIGLDFVF